MEKIGSQTFILRHFPKLDIMFIVRILGLWVVVGWFLELASGNPDRDGSSIRLFSLEDF